jgi:two-component sensor histidine kinase/ABC-type amino acid transport substrate-binding protein
MVISALKSYPLGIASVLSRNAVGKPGNVVTRSSFRTAAFLVCVCLTTVASAKEGRVLRVGIFPAAPLVMVDGDTPSGLFIDLIDYFSRERGWKPFYVQGEWSDLLKRLESGDIDLLPAVGYTSERAHLFDFGKHPVYIDSGVLFTRPKYPLHTIFDLDGKKVSAVRGSIFTQGFIEYVASFGVACDIVYMPDNPAVMSAIEEGEVDAGVCIYSLGTELAKKYRVTVTPISFSPIALAFAVPKHQNADILQDIDELMEPMLSDDQSVYSRSLRKWTAQVSPKGIPAWLLWSVVSLLGVGVLLGVWNLTLRGQVIMQTRHLEAEIAERKQAEDAVRRSLAEKETLIQELFHRTRNTLQTIQALLELQVGALPMRPELQLLMRNIESRIQSISLVHKMLFKSNDLSHIPLDRYTRDLSLMLMESYDISPERVSIEIRMGEQELLIDTAIPFGLILNELMTNSLTHAFPSDRAGSISITLDELDAERNRLVYADDGVGVPEGFDFRLQNTLGLSLIFSLGEQQLGGAVEFQSDHGVRCSIDFPKTLYTARV